MEDNSAPLRTPSPNPSLAASENDSIRSYSTNAKTVAARKRKATMTPEQTQRNRKRLADNEAVRRARARVKKSVGFQSLSQDAQDQAIAAAEAKIRQKRAAKDQASQTDEDFYVKSYVEAQKLARRGDDQEQWDSGSENEMLTAENEILARIYEPRYTKDLQDLSAIDVAQRQKAINHTAKGMKVNPKDIEWRHFRDFWNKAIKQFWTKVDILESGQLADSDGVHLSKTLLLLMNVQTKQVRKPGYRPDVRRTSVLFRSRGDLVGKPNNRLSLYSRRGIHMPWWTCAKSDKARLRAPAAFNAKTFNKNMIRLAMAVRNGTAIGPDCIFAPKERVIFRNVAAWHKELLQGGQLKLPGPACLWSEMANYEPEADVYGARSIYNFLVKHEREDKAPLAFSNMLKSETELRWKCYDEVDDFDREW